MNPGTVVEKTGVSVHYEGIIPCQTETTMRKRSRQGYKPRTGKGDSDQKKYSLPRTNVDVWKESDGGAFLSTLGSPEKGKT